EQRWQSEEVFDFSRLETGCSVRNEAPETVHAANVRENPHKGSGVVSEVILTPIEGEKELDILVQHIRYLRPDQTTAGRPFRVVHMRIPIPSELPHSDE